MPIHTYLAVPCNEYQIQKAATISLQGIIAAFVLIDLNT